MREMDAQPASLSPNLDSSSAASRGMTVSAVARIFIVFLMVFGPYLGSLFSFSWQVLPSAQAATNSAPVSSEVASATNSGPMRAPQPRVSVDCPATFANNGSNGSSTPLSGVWGLLTDLDGTTGFGLVFTATLLSADFSFSPNFNYTPLAVTDGGTDSGGVGTNAGGGVFNFTTNGDGWGNTSQPAKSGQLMILRFDPYTGDQVRQTTYFDFFRGGGLGGREIGRYSPETATRFFLANDGIHDCIAYAVVAQQALINQGLTPASPSIATNSGITGIPSDMAVITMTTANYKRIFGGVAPEGRSIGGRIFEDTGDPNNTNPAPYYPYPGGDLGVSAYLYPFGNSQVITFSDADNSPAMVATQGVDAEGYYNLFGSTTSQLIPARTNARYLLRLRGQSPGQIATSLYCNYFYRASSTDPKDGFKLGFTVPVTTTATGPQGPLLNPPLTNGNVTNPNGGGVPDRPEPCYSSNATKGLQLSGYHFVVRGDIQINGTISLNGSSNPNNAVIGAYAAAIDKNTKQIVSLSDPVDASGQYKILNLQPNTQYGVEFFPPPALSNYIPNYYNGKELDQPPTLLTQTTTAVGSSTIAGIDDVLNTGWSFKGTVTLNPGGSGAQASDVRVQVFRTSDLLDGTPNPIPLSQVSPDAGGNYTTDPVMQPGISYTLAFVPANSAIAYKVGWCGSTLPNCAPQSTAVSAGGHLVSSSEGGLPRQIAANVTLSQGVQLTGNVSGAGDTGSALHLHNGGGVSIYVYQVNLDSQNHPISPTLAEYFGSDTASVNIPYNTAALETGANYVIKAVANNNDSLADPNDPGYRAGYYCGSSCGGGNYDLSHAAVINQPNVGVFPGYDISLSRAAAITVQLYTYLYSVTNTNAYFPNVKVQVYSSGGVGGYPVGTGLTRSDGTAFVKGLPVESPNGQPYNVYFSPQGFGSNSGTLQGIAAYKGDSDCGLPPADVAVGAGQIATIVCKMPPFAGINGQITPNLPDNPGNDWSNATLNVFDNGNPSKLVLVLNNDGKNLLINHQNNSSPWLWSVLVPPGSYRFQMTPNTNLRKTYLPTWYVSVVGNGVSAADAIVANLSPDFAQSNANFNFQPGGALAVKVTDDLGQILNAATVTYYGTTGNACNYSQPLYSFQVAGQGPLTGYAYSTPYSQPLCIQATPPPNSPYQSNQAGPFALTDGRGNVAIVTTTIQLKPTPLVTGYMRIRNYDGVNSYETPFISATVRAVDLTDQTIVGSVAQTDGNGFYRLPLPTGAFKIRFEPVSGTTQYKPRYWMSTAAQNGTPSFDQANVIVPVDGKTYTNYNVIYDLTQLGNTECQITNQYVDNLKHDPNDLTGVNYQARVVFYTNCTGDSRVTSNFVPDIASGTIFSNTTESVFTHTVIVTGLSPNGNGTTYYLYPSSQMVYIGDQNLGTQITRTEFVTATTPLQIYVPLDNPPTTGATGDGTNWFFAQGQTSSDPNSGISETIFLANYKALTATVTISYYNGTQGFLGAKNLTVAPNSRVDVKLDNPTDPSGAALASILVNGAPYYGKHSTWVKSSAPIVVERYQTAAGTINGYPYKGGYNLVGATTPGTVAWFPEIRTLSTYQQSVTVFNPNSVPICVRQFYYLTYTGTNSIGTAPLQIDPGFFVVQPFSRKQIDPNYVIHTMIGDQAPGVNRFSLRLRSEITPACSGTGGVANPLIAELQTFYADPSGSTYYRGVTGIMGGQIESQTWYLLDGQSDKVTSDQYIITNKSGLPTTVTVTFQVDNPKGGNVSVISQTSFVIPPQLRYDYSVPFTVLNRSLVGRQVGFTSRIDASQNVIVQRSAKYIYNAAQSQTGLYQEMGTTQPSVEWLFAAGDTSSSADGQAVSDEGFNLYNPNLETVVVSFTYYYRVSGSSVPTQAVFGSYILPALSRTTIKPSLPNNDIGGSQPYSTYPSVGANKYFAVQINSSRAVFAERVLYFTKPGGKYGGNASYGWNPPPGSR